MWINWKEMEVLVNVQQLRTDGRNSDLKAMIYSAPCCNTINEQLILQYIDLA